VEGVVDVDQSIVFGYLDEVDHAIDHFELLLVLVMQRLFHEGNCLLGDYATQLAKGILLLHFYHELLSHPLNII
jgi:hypothetical protein